jgi:hypothetical protein
VIIVFGVDDLNLLIDIFHFFPDSGDIDGDIHIDVLNFHNMHRAHHKLNDQTGNPCNVVFFVLLPPFCESLCFELTDQLPTHQY